MDKTIELLKTLSETDGVPGFEGDVARIMADRLRPCGRVTPDRVGGLVCEIPGAAASPRVLLDAHTDEVGFMVQHIHTDGFLKFVTLGSWPKAVMPGLRVRVGTRSGQAIAGTIASMPPHFQKDGSKDRVADEDELFIDIGARDADQTLEWGVYLGAPVAPATPFAVQPGGEVVSGKAFDDRAGCAVAIEVAEALHSAHPNTVVVAASAQEELGCRGTRTTCHLARPDVAIVLETPPADDAAGMARESAQGRMGGGVQIRRRDTTAMCNPRLCDLAAEVAERRGIPFQVAVRRGGGTDAKEIHLFEHGVPTVVLGVPVRYIHAPMGFLRLSDFAAARDLAVALIEVLDAKTVDTL